MTGLQFSRLVTTKVSDLHYKMHRRTIRRLWLIYFHWVFLGWYYDFMNQELATSGDIGMVSGYDTIYVWVVGFEKELQNGVRHDWIDNIRGADCIACVLLPSIWDVSQST